MFRKDKKLFVTLILMLIIVASLITITWFYEGHNQISENVIAQKDKSYAELKEDNIELQAENKKIKDNQKTLEEENEKLKAQLDSVISDGYDSAYNQALIDLSDISNMIKEGNIKGAKSELSKINPMGFDPSVLAFYESLCRELNIKEN